MLGVMSEFVGREEADGEQHLLCLLLEEPERRRDAQLLSLHNKHGPACCSCDPQHREIDAPDIVLGRAPMPNEAVLPGNWIYIDANIVMWSILVIEINR